MVAPYAIADDALLAQCDITSSSSHGPGGQHRNKTESAVRLRHKPTGLTSQCEDHRERGRNRVDALKRLRVRLVVASRGSSDPAWMAPYRRGRQVALGAKAQEYHLVAACCLDALAAAGGSLADAARALAISSTQLVKLLVADKEIHQAANAIRAAAGMGAVRG
ncbi:MAG: peptide chain release factor-like protein [Planctomycetes bacterium]|nr:peptide chain release factor-like protein [Planctomycetota bacterium]